jgi:lipopolysaccharide/colanic/teichoic acid biosynthesis glycosyltransferase
MALDPARKGILGSPLSPGQQIYVALRRPVEVALVLLLGLVCLPIVVVVAIAIKLESPGGILFRQERVGKDGRVFTLYKLRTMHITAPAYSYKVSSAHPSITRMGRFLRRSCLDEVPQFWNVIKGDLSLIGPRPEMAFIVAEYDEWHHQRHIVRPGITGWWQVNNRSEEPMHQALSYDFYYLAKIGPVLDAVIVARTIIVMVSGALYGARIGRDRRGLDL